MRPTFAVSPVSSAHLHKNQWVWFSSRPRGVRLAYNTPTLFCSRWRCVLVANCWANKTPCRSRLRLISSTQLKKWYHSEPSIAHQQPESLDKYIYIIIIYITPMGVSVSLARARASAHKAFDFLLPLPLLLLLRLFLFLLCYPISNESHCALLFVQRRPTADGCNLMFVFTIGALVQ